MDREREREREREKGEIICPAQKGRKGSEMSVTSRLGLTKLGKCPLCGKLPTNK